MKVVALGLFALLLGACVGPIVRPARFRQRPESVKRGSQLGPFVGRVVDADTGKPLEKTLIWCSWAFNRGVGSPAPDATRTFEVHTDPDGRYRIPRLKALPLGLSTHLARFTLVALRSGYVAYRHDRRFAAGAEVPHRRRTTFSQLHNEIKLSKWSPELSHARHLLFMGGPPSLRGANAKALLAAAIELDRPTPQTTAKTTPGLVAKSPARLLLVSDQVRQVTGYSGTLRGSPLNNAGDATASWHLRAVDKAERYDVAVRLWRLNGDALVKRYEALLNALPGAKQVPLVGDRSFFISQGQITGLGFLSQTHGALVLLTCGKGQCTTDKQLQELAKKVAGNLPKLSKDAPLGGK